MKNASVYAKRLASLLRTLKGAVDAPEYEPTPPVEQLIRAFLQWETTSRQAEPAYNRLMRHMVDHNDLRVSDPQDIADALGDRYSRTEERAVRLRLVLRDVYDREHAVSLERLQEMAKRDARAYLDELTGMVPYVSASVMLLSLGGHAVPVDEQLVAKLKKDEIVDPDATLDEVVAFLEHHIKAADGVRAHFLLRGYIEQSISPRSARRTRKTTKKTTKRSTKTTKKTTKKSTNKRTTKRSTKKRTTQRKR